MGSIKVIFPKIFNIKIFLNENKRHDTILIIFHVNFFLTIKTHYS